MDIKVIEDDVLRNIQNDFQKQYPFLKIQFYKCFPIKDLAASDADKLATDTPLEDATLFHSAGTISIAPERTVSEVEHDFLKMFGLLVQIFRKSRKGWTLASTEGLLTLQRQNEKGKEYSLPYRPTL